MKQSVSTTLIFWLVLVVTFLFSTFLVLAINYNKIYRLKNEVINIIEKREGIYSEGVFRESSIKVINSYLKNNGYKTKGKCSIDIGEIVYGVNNLDDDSYVIINPGDKYYYCFLTQEVPNTNQSYVKYDIKLFYNFNLPFIGDLFTFSINGQSKNVKKAF